jgi:dephospho-CoA kinase
MCKNQKSERSEQKNQSKSVLSVQSVYHHPKSLPTSPMHHLQIGITGGIGSGKTTVCKMLETLGVPVYYADDAAKWLMVNDVAVKEKIIEAFGEAAYLSDGQLNRAHLASVIFTDAAKREVLNQIVHPAVREHGRLWHEEQCAKGATYTVKEAALLIESGSYKDLDALVLVTAPQQVRIARVMARDGHDRKAIVQRIKSQMTDRDRRPFAQFFIDNSGKKALIPQVMKLHQAISEM